MMQSLVGVMRKSEQSSRGGRGRRRGERSEHQESRHNPLMGKDMKDRRWWISNLRYSAIEHVQHARYESI